jgi:heterodisulfide reductase subunit A-like polyferredoxin
MERNEASKPELEAFALAVLRPQGKVVRIAMALRLFLLGMHMITEQHSRCMSFSSTRYGIVVSGVANRASEVSPTHRVVDQAIQLQRQVCND